MRTAVALCAALLVTAATATAAYHVSNNDQPAVSNTGRPVEIPGIISSLTASLPSTYSFLHHLPDSASDSIGYQVSGYDYQVTFPSDSPNMNFSDSFTVNEQKAYADLSKVATSISDYLGRQGFAAVSSQDQTSGLLSTDYFYARSDAVCHVAVYETLSLVCSSSQDLSTIAVSAEPLVDAYKAAVTVDATLRVAAPYIRASQTSGYIIATLPVFDTNGLTNVNLYMQGRTVWQVVPLGWYNDPHESGDILPNCADFESSTVISRAFADVSCYDSATRASRAIHPE